MLRKHQSSDQKVLPPPAGPALHCQKAWDAPKLSATADTLLKQAPDTVTHSRLLAASAKESGAWLMPSLFHHWAYAWTTTLFVLQLVFTSAQPCASHTPVAAVVDGTASHGLSCRWSKGQHYHHAAVNDIVQVMTAAHLPFKLEPTSLLG